MKNAHYPSLELCKKLTKIGFPYTEKNFIRAESAPLTIVEIYGEEDWMVITNANFPKDWINYKCPSVMEMLDIMPKVINVGKLPYTLNIMTGGKDTDYGIQYLNYSYADTHTYCLSDLTTIFWTIPNALASMVLWLHENKYTSFSK